MPTRATFAAASEQVLMVVAGVWAITLFAIGVSFVAADRATGALTTWLTFVPDRVRGLAAKLLAFGAACLAVSSVASAAGVLVVAVLAGQWSTPLADADLIAGMGARVVAFCVLSGLLGCAVGAITGRTTVAIGAAAGYVALSLGSYLLLYGRSHLPRFELLYQAVAWLRGNQFYSVWDAPEVHQFEISALHGGITWLAVTVLALGVGFVVHARRDVT